MHWCERIGWFLQLQVGVLGKKIILRVLQSTNRSISQAQDFRENSPKSQQKNACITNKMTLQQLVYVAKRRHVETICICNFRIIKMEITKHPHDNAVIIVWLPVRPTKRYRWARWLTTTTAASAVSWWHRAAVAKCDCIEAVA